MRKSVGPIGFQGIIIIPNDQRPTLISITKKDLKGLSVPLFLLLDIWASWLILQLQEVELGT